MGGESEERSEGSAGRAGNRDRRARFGVFGAKLATHATMLLLCGAERQPRQEETAGSLTLQAGALKDRSRLRTQP